MIKKSLLAAAISVLATGNVHAADIVAPLYDWTGLYAGVNAGWGWGDIDTTDNSITTSGALVGITPGSFDPPAMFPGSDRSDEADGFLGGVQVGYNYQLSQWVFGIEGDYQFSDFDADSSFPGSSAGPFFQTSGELMSFGTLRLRAGYAFNDVLIYGTGGLAVGRGKASLSVQGGVPGAFTGPEFSESETEWLVGFAIGAGVEYAIDSAWSIKGEYLYSELGSEDFDFDFSGTPGDKAHSEGRIFVNIARVGLNYRF